MCIRDRINVTHLAEALKSNRTLTELNLRRVLFSDDRAVGAEFGDALKVNSTLRVLRIDLGAEGGDAVCEGVVLNRGLIELTQNLNIRPNAAGMMLGQIMDNKVRLRSENVALRCIFKALWGTCGSWGIFDDLPVELLHHMIMYICEYSFSLLTTQVLLDGSHKTDFAHFIRRSIS
eukprot:TRINITY_DN14840_c0_g1_i1.p1 TRINITY_DN14840_c0_g1~~TRINITY_DN14840_c0_g1_i1.p1  ORF type:complete len:176 (-),score=25.87 TRINITY_DN14840_c0_g1_i1:478-1005(-)